MLGMLQLHAIKITLVKIFILCWRRIRGEKMHINVCACNKNADYGSSNFTPCHN